ncbi:MAG: beta-lactamase family protein [Pyrinomonadaceae bacterium]|nr:beta-lactamase family protein [Pyrinomonadaceae bacterium]
MLNRFSIVVLLVVLSASFYGVSARSAADQDNKRLKERLQVKIDDWHKSAKFSGATLGVTLANGDSFGLATGYSDRVKKTPMKADDYMLAGSVGKTYVAAVALQLVDEGKIDLDARIGKYLGGEEWFQKLPNANDIVIRQLMNHTSGLVRYEFNPNFLKDLLKDPYKVWKPEEQISYLFGSKPPFGPGKGWDYSDTNYIVLGMIIEKVTGQKYYELAKARLLKPLKLERTKPQTGPKIDGLIQGYAGKGNPFGGEDEMIKNGKFVFNPQFEWTGGGIVTTSKDLSRWAKMLYEGKAFSSEMLKEMLDGVESRQLGPNSKYGLGVIIRPTSKGLSYGHSGFFPGYLTEVMYFPEDKIAIAVQVNSSVPKDVGRPLGRAITEAFDAIKNSDASDSEKRDQGSR